MIENLCRESSLSEAVLHEHIRRDGSKAAKTPDNWERQVITLNSCIAG